MRQPGVGDSVRFLRDVPELLVQRNELGIVCSIWFSPNDAFEVELGDADSRRRVLVRSGDIAVAINDPPRVGGEVQASPLAAPPQFDAAGKGDVGNGAECVTSRPPGTVGT